MAENPPLFGAAKLTDIAARALARGEQDMAVLLNLRFIVPGLGPEAAQNALQGAKWSRDLHIALQQGELGIAAGFARLIQQSAGGEVVLQGVADIWPEGVQPGAPGVQPGERMVRIIVQPGQSLADAMDELRRVAQESAQEGIGLDTPGGGNAGDIRFAGLYAQG